MAKRNEDGSVQFRVSELYDLPPNLVVHREAYPWPEDVGRYTTSTVGEILDHWNMEMTDRRGDSCGSVWKLLDPLQIAMLLRKGVVKVEVSDG